jgi:hypothetical protein
MFVTLGVCVACLFALVIHIRKLHKKIVLLEFGLRISKERADRFDRDADNWQSKYSGQLRENKHLEMERDALRGQLMAKQGASEN